VPSRTFLILAICIALASLVLSGYNLWNQKNINQDVGWRQDTPAASPQPLPLTPSPVVATVSSQVLQLEEKVTTLEERLLILENKKSVSSSAVKSGVRENFLYLGTGSSTNRDWTNIDAASITFDTQSYGKIKEIRFEAALSIISGEVQARLINKTTGAVYYDSTVMHNKSTSEWKTSSPISLPSGNNQYVVQLRSSNNERASLDGSRLKILVE